VSGRTPVQPNWRSAQREIAAKSAHNGLMPFRRHQSGIVVLNASLIVRKATTFRGLAPADRKLALAALALLAAVRIALWLLPFRRLIRWLRKSSVRRSGQAGCAPRRVAWAVRLAGRYMPAATCLPQALTAYLLLNRQGHSSCLRIGVAYVPEFEAHAWVECDGEVVVGGSAGLDRFANILTLDTR